MTSKRVRFEGHLSDELSGTLHRAENARGGILMAHCFTCSIAALCASGAGMCRCPRIKMAGTPSSLTVSINSASSRADGSDSVLVPGKIRADGIVLQIDPASRDALAAIGVQMPAAAEPHGDKTIMDVYTIG